MLAMITALRISYFMVIKIIFFSEKSPDRSEILAYNPEMQQKFIHCLWSDREGSNILYLVPKKYKTAPSKGPHSKHKGEFLCMKSTNLCIHKVCPDSQESNPRRQNPSLVTQMGHLRICHCSSAKEHIIALTQLSFRGNVETYLCFLTLPSLSGHRSSLIEAADLSTFPHSLTSICSTD